MRAVNGPTLIFSVSTVFQHRFQPLTNGSTALISDSIWTAELTGSVSNPRIELKKPQTNLGHQLLNIEISPVCKQPFPGQGTFTEVQWKVHFIHPPFVLWCVCADSRGLTRLNELTTRPPGAFTGGPEPGPTCGVPGDAPGGSLSQIKSKQKDNNWANKDLLWQSGCWC